MQLSPIDVDHAVMHAQRSLPAALDDCVQAAAARQAFGLCFGVHRAMRSALAKVNGYPLPFLEAASAWYGADIGGSIVQPYGGETAAEVRIDFSRGSAHCEQALQSHARTVLVANGVQSAAQCREYLAGLQKYAQEVLEQQHRAELEEFAQTEIVIPLPPSPAQLLRAEEWRYQGLRRALAQSIPTVEFSDIGGNSAPKIALMEAVRDFHSTELREAWGLPVEKYFLLFGPPGTGKSTLAYAHAHALQLPVHELSLAELFDPYIGNTERNLHAAFGFDGVLILNEFDSLGGTKDADDHRVYVNCVNAIAMELDRRKKDPRFHVIATVNGRTRIEDKLQRRFTQLYVGPPSPEEMQEIFAIHLQHRSTAPIFGGIPGEIPSDEISGALAQRSAWLAEQGLPPLTGADIERIVDQAFRQQFQHHRDSGEVRYPSPQTFLGIISNYFSRPPQN